MTWRDKLGYTVRNSRMRQSEIARRAGIAPETLSRIINGKHSRPAFSTVIRIARAVRVDVGWLLDEPRGVEFTQQERATLRAAAVILFETVLRSPGSKSG